MIDEILKSTIKYNKGGSNSKCFCFDKYAFLYGSINVDEIDELIKTIDEYKKRGINLCSIYEYKLDQEEKLKDFGKGKRYQAGWILEERANGEELYMRDTSSFNSIESFDDDYLNFKGKLNYYIDKVNEYSEIPNSQLEKFIDDYILLQDENKLFVDPSKASNFFYDKEKGFTFIDILLSSNKKNDFNSPTWSSIYVITQLYPFPGNVLLKDLSDKSNFDYFNYPLTEEEFNKVVMAEHKLYNKLVEILKDKNVDLPMIKDRIEERFIEKNEFINILPDEESRKNFLLNKMKEMINKDDKRI